jgi:hypothetical protein
MINSFIKWTILLLMLIAASTAEGQVRSFSPEPAGFIVEFETFIKTADQKKLNEDLALFKENWNLGKFSPTQQQSIIRICNDMLTEGMPVQPHFDLMLQSISGILENKLPEKTLTQWQQVIWNF